MPDYKGMEKTHDKEPATSNAPSLGTPRSGPDGLPHVTRDNSLKYKAFDGKAGPGIQNSNKM